MSLNFYLTDDPNVDHLHVQVIVGNQSWPINQPTALSIGMTYVDFDALRNDIEAIANEVPNLVINKHPGLVKYMQVLDAEDLMTTNECLDLYQLLQSNAFADLAHDYRLSTLLTALKQAGIQHQHLMWM